MTTGSFTLEETTIKDVHRAMKSGEITSEGLVEQYLRRIEAYDRGGPELNAITRTNPQAKDEARRCDEQLEETGELGGPLHGIPVLVKDQAETEGLTTSFGSIAFKDYVPNEDATVVKKLREAGAVVLAKTNLCDFATAFFSFSSLSGETRNPYALDREPGGSSAGTGAGLAANLGTVGLGEDTGGSIRVPAAYNNLCGIRVTTGLISREGLSPLVFQQDTAGPMARTMEDVATVLDVLVGYDPADQYTGNVAAVQNQGSYADQLDERALEGARIGVLRQVFGPDDQEDCSEVNRVINRAIEEIGEAGAEVIDPVQVENLDELLDLSSLYIVQSKYAVNTFFASRPEAPVDRFEEMYEAGQYHESLDLFEAMAEEGPDDPEEDPDYFKRLYARHDFQRAVLDPMGQHDLDALLFPNVQVEPPRRSDLLDGKYTTMTFPTNTLIGSQTSFPGVSVPAGFTDDGLPVGLELLGAPYQEARLLSLGYAYEQATGHRRPPESAPPL